MTYEELFEFVDAEPFRPFRIRMASGRTFDVRHPHEIRVGVDTVLVFEFDRQDERLCKNFNMLGFERMKSAELIDSSVVRGHE